ILLRMKMIFINEIAWDTSFIVGKEKKLIKAHSEILKRSSSYFSKLLEGTNKKDILIEDYSPELFKNILEYLYTGDIDINEKNIISIISFAFRLDLPELIENCLLIIPHFLTPETFVDYFQQLYKLRQSYSYHLSLYNIKGLCQENY